MLAFLTRNPNEDSEAKADQEHHKHQNKMPFRQGVEPHWSQPVKKKEALSCGKTHRKPLKCLI